MARFMFQAAYTPEAMSTLARVPQDRVAGVRALAEAMGGKLESFDYCLGDYDVVVIYEAPDDITAAAVALAASAPGHLKAGRTTRLLTNDEFMAAQKMASEMHYQGPKTS